MDPAATTNTNQVSSFGLTTSSDDTPPSPLGSPPSVQIVSPVQNASTESVISPPMPTVASAGNPSGKKRRNVILIGVAVLLMLGGIATGVYLLTQRPFERSYAWNCELYKFSVDKNGTVTVMNGSLSDEPEQKADVYINGNLIQTLDVPALPHGEGATIGTVQVPTSGEWTWLVDGSKDCDNSGTNPAASPKAQCIAVKAFNDQWEPLNAEELSALKAGDVIRFSVAGTADPGEITKARFQINGVLRDEVTQKRPGSDEFYDEYIIPADEFEFNVNAQLFHASAGWF